MYPLRVSTQGMPSLESLQGFWYVNMSDSPTWIKGKQKNPTFYYCITTDSKGNNALNDRYTYIKNRTAFQQYGISTPTYNIFRKHYKNLNKSLVNGKFIRKQKSIFRINKTSWKIKYYSKKHKLILILLGQGVLSLKTYVVLSRKKQLSVDQEEAVLKILEKKEIIGLDFINQNLSLSEYPKINELRTATSFR